MRYLRWLVRLTMALRRTGNEGSLRAVRLHVLPPDFCSFDSEIHSETLDRMYIISLSLRPKPYFPWGRLEKRARCSSVVPQRK